MLHGSAPRNDGREESFLFAETPDADLLAYGVPPDWLADVKAATESRLFDLADHLPQETAEALWQVFAAARAALDAKGLVTLPSVYGRVTEAIAADGSPFDFVIVDEAQDMTVPAMRLFAALAAGRPDGLFLAGDQGQRIFQTPFSWKSLGVDIRGRSHILRINYRTSHQIRSQAGRLLPGAITDVDGNEESRRGTVSVFNGPVPEVGVLDDETEEIAAVGA